MKKNIQAVSQLAVELEIRWRNVVKLRAPGAGCHIGHGLFGRGQNFLASVLASIVLDQSGPTIHEASYWSTLTIIYRSTEP